MIYHPHRLDDLILPEYRKARAAFLAGEIERADQIWSALRRNACVDIWYEIDLPDPVKFIHPLSSVLSRATYGSHLVVYNSCSVGRIWHKGSAPVLGNGVVLMPGSRVLGGCQIGDNVIIMPNVCLIDHTIPSNSIVHSNSITSMTKNVVEMYFGDEM